MKNYEKYFENHEVPERLKNTAIAIMKRFTISGLCDGMYICNTIALNGGIGDGNGTFTGSSISNIPQVARNLQSAYGCNIFKEDLKELENILESGELDKTTAISGINVYISKCKKEIESNRDSWRIDYLNRCIAEATETLQMIC